LIIKNCTYIKFFFFKFFDIFEKEITSLDKQLVSLESKMSLKHKELLSLRDDKKTMQEQLSQLDTSISSN